MKLLSALAAIAGISFASHAISQDDLNYIFSEESLGLVHSASITINDGVTDGCWTNADAILQKSRLTLEQSGISVYLEPLATSYPQSAAIYIEAFGNRSSGNCIGFIEVGISDIASRYLGETQLIGEISYFRKQNIAFGRSLNPHFAIAVENSINELAAQILSNRRSDTVSRLIDQRGNVLRAKPETNAELWERLGIDPPQ